MSRSVPQSIASLPHWARVAFAARCSRNVLPLFERFWPGALARRLVPLRSAIQLAEQSAGEGQPAPRLEKAIVASVMTAGAALAPKYGFSPGKEPVPVDEHAGQIASFVAKSAEWAARAAQEGPAGSVNAALEAYTWARDAAHMAEAVDVLARLQDDFSGLCRVAAPRPEAGGRTRRPCRLPFSNCCLRLLQRNRGGPSGGEGPSGRRRVEDWDGRGHLW